MAQASPFPAGQELQKPVCVFCGSSPGTQPVFSRAAESVGRAFAENRIPLIYGGGRRGIMGVVSKAVLEAGGYAHGITPRALMQRASERTATPGSAPNGDAKDVKSKEGQGDDLLDEEYGGRLTMEVTGSMHDRKLKMAQYSTGGFVVLPGGYGTFEELMEMVTWNQLGIHQLPVIVVNVGNFYAPLKTLLEGAVSAGFIAPDNLSLLQVIDLDGEAGQANSDESRVDEWGAAVVKALKEWKLPEFAGYKLQWDDNLKAAETEPAHETEKPDRVGLAHAAANDIAGPSEPRTVKLETSSGSVSSIPFSLFTTMRYTSSTESKPFDMSRIPLLEYHLDRLRDAHAYFATRDGQSIWGPWVGDDRVRRAIETKLQAQHEEAPGDYRVRVLIHPRSEVDVQAVPAPLDAGPFQLLPQAKADRTRTLLFDLQDTDLSAEVDSELDLRLYKTTRRAIYDAATTRAESITGVSHQEVLLHTATRILETSTSNIAIWKPQAGSPDWLTPKLDQTQSPFLCGVMRRYLLEQGVIRQGEVSVEDIWEMKRAGGRVIGFNGLRGVWEAKLV